MSNIYNAIRSMKILLLLAMVLVLVDSLRTLKHKEDKADH